jgi:hypothetical protein
MLDGILQVTINPLAFFRALADDGRLASRAIIIVLMLAVLSGVVGYFSVLPTSDAFAGSPFATVALVTAPVSAVIVSFISWLVYGLLVRIGAGMRVKPWAVTAYSLAPQLFLYTLLIVVAALFPVRVPAVAVDFNDPASVQQASEVVQRAVTTSVYGRVSQVVSYLATLWMLVLIYLGVDIAADQRKALIATVLVALPSLGLIVAPLLLAPVG